MATTKWGSVWGSVWGGGDGPPGYLAVGFTAKRGSTSSLWLADAEHTPSLDVIPGSVEAGDVIGWAPKYGAEFSLSGHFSGVVIHDQLSETFPWTFHILTSTRTRSKPCVTSADIGDSIVHAELYGDENVTTAPHGRKPAFVLFKRNTGTNVIEARNIRLEDPSTFTTANVWNNELLVDVTASRFVSLPNLGTVIVAVAPSTIYAGHNALWLKSTFGTGAASPAKEIKVDLRPSSVHTLDLTRLHVVETANQSLVFYYAVHSPDTGYATASFTYNPVHGNYTVDLAFDSTGIIRKPKVVYAGYVPVVAHKGARRHPVTNDTILALEPSGTVQGNVVSWFKCRGYTKTLSAPFTEWKASTHPYLFGGKLTSSVPAREIKLISVGWADTRQGGHFRVVGGLRLGEALPGQGDSFKNYFRTTHTATSNTWRLCLGVVYTPNDTECNVSGYHSCLAVDRTRIEVEEARRNGYNLTYDLYAAKQLLRLSSVTTGVTAADVGLAGTVTGGAVSSPGMVGSSTYFPNHNSRVEIAYADITSTGLVVSFWVYPEISGRVGDPDQFTIARRAADATDSWRFYWVESTKTIKFYIGLDGGIGYNLDTSILGALRENTWYKITGTYDAVTATARLYVDGCSVGYQVAAPGKILRNPTVATSIFLGDDNDPARSSFLGRIDDFVVGDGNNVGPQVVAQEFHLCMLAKDWAPMKSSRSASYNYQDAVTATAAISGDTYSNRFFTYNVRKMSINAIKNLRGNFCVDVWQHLNGSDPVFMGVIAPPWQTLNKAEGLVPPSGYIQTVMVEDDTTVCGIKVIRSQDTSTTTHSVYIVVKQDPVDVTCPVRTQIWRVTLDPLSVVSWAESASNYELVAELDDGAVTAFEPVFIKPTTGTVGNHVVLVGTVEAAESRFYIVDQANFGPSALSVSNYKTVAQMAPPTGSGYSHFSTDYASEFSDSTDMSIRGIVAREIQEGSGIGNAAYGGILAYYGICSNGGSSIPAASEAVQLVSTSVAVISPDSISGVFSFYVNGEPRQWDQRGIGGVDPFIPMSWVQNPLSPLRESFILGKSGIRPVNTAGVHGAGDLLVYRVDNTGLSGLVPIIVAGPDIESGKLTDNAAMCVSTSTTDSSSPNVFLHVTRPSYSAYDEFSPIQVSQVEATHGGWTAYTYTAATPVLRRNDRATTSATYTYVVSLRNMSWSKAGPAVLAGSTSKAIVSMEWGATVLT